MKNLLLFLLLIVMSITAFSQRKFELPSSDYHVVGMLITENETPNFLMCLNEAKNLYQQNIITSKYWNVIKYKEKLDISTYRIHVFFYGSDIHTYDFSVIPYFTFEVKNGKDSLEYLLTLHLDSKEPGSNGYDNVKGFKITFKNTKEIIKFENKIKKLSNRNWLANKYLKIRYDNSYALTAPNGQKIMKPYYLLTWLKDAPKGNKITRIKSGNKVTILNEGVKYAFDDFLKVTYKQDTGWVSIRSFKPQDVYTIRNSNCIIWMDNKNVNF